MYTMSRELILANRRLNNRKFDLSTDYLDISCGMIRHVVSF